MLLNGGETLELAGITFDVLSVPGHSPAHLAYAAEDALFSGDVLFAGGVGRVDLPGGDWDTLLDSIRMLGERFPPETDRLLRPRPADDPRRRARAQPVPRRAPRRPPVKFEAPRGTHDILPSQQPLWRRATGEIERLCALYGYRPIQTPVFEDTGLFARTSGQGSDIVQKEMYSFEDRGGRPLTLRPEGTAPICRAYLEHGMHREPQPVKLYTIATMYRYAAPQRGRYREHWQASVEAIGSEDPAVDAEIVQLYDTLLGNLGVTEYTLQLNSIGDRNCRPAVRRGAPRLARGARADLDEDTRRKLETSPLRALDNLEQKPPHVQEVLREAPTIADALCDECRAHFAAVREALDAYGVGYSSSRPSSAGSTTTRARPGSSSARRARRRARSPAAAATTTSSRRSAARRRPVSASAPGSSASCSRWRAPARPQTRRRWTSSSCSTAATARRRSGSRATFAAAASPPTSTTRAARSRAS